MLKKKQKQRFLIIINEALRMYVLWCVSIALAQFRTTGKRNFPLKQETPLFNQYLQNKNKQFSELKAIYNIFTEFLSAFL